MTTTPFLELAKRIDADMCGAYHCCTDLPQKLVPWFTEMFKPSPDEMDQYKMDDYVWLTSFDLSISIEGDNSFRILILLLAHEVWLDENNDTKK